MGVVPGYPFGVCLPLTDVLQQCIVSICRRGHSAHFVCSESVRDLLPLFGNKSFEYQQEVFLIQSTI